jgi:hypothetical protein
LVINRYMFKIFFILSFFYLGSSFQPHKNPYNPLIIRRTACTQRTVQYVRKSRPLFLQICKSPKNVRTIHFFFGGWFGVAERLCKMASAALWRIFSSIKSLRISQNGRMSAKFRVLAKTSTDIFVSSLEVRVAPFVFHL